MENNFGWLDFVSVGATLALTALIGIFFGNKNKTNEHLLMGGREINHWPVALSLMASYISAITVIGYPSEISGHGIEIFNMAIILLVTCPLSVAAFVPFLYPMKLTSIFDYLERRFGCKTLRKIVSGIYIFEQIALSGVILYGPTFVLFTFLGIPNWLSIFGIGILCTLYTCMGGLKAVVWTDALQAVVMVIGMLAIMTKAFIDSEGISNSFKIAEDNGRLNLLNMNFDIFQRHNFFNFWIGFGFLGIFRSTIHQQQVQRFSSQPTLEDAKKAMFLSVPISFSVSVIGVLTGIAVFAIYAYCDPVILGKIKTIDHLIPHFVVTEMSTWPGILGLFTACIFSSVLSSISSSLNSLTAVTWEDFLSPMPVFAKMNFKQQANVSRITGLIYGILCIGLAFSAQYMGSIYSASYQVLGASSGVVVATFLAGFFTRHINATGAKFGALVGYGLMLTLGMRNIFSESLKEPLLPTSVTNCTTNQIMTYGNSTFVIKPAPYISIEWPDKIFTISYLMYPLLGATITLTVATIVSLCTGGWKNRNKVSEKYLHPLIRRKQHHIGNGTATVLGNTPL